MWKELLTNSVLHVEFHDGDGVQVRRRDGRREQRQRHRRMLALRDALGDLVRDDGTQAGAEQRVRLTLQWRKAAFGVGWAMTRCLCAFVEKTRHSWRCRAALCRLPLGLK